MSHPILETLFFLKIARQSVCESIKNSDVEDKPGLINYIQNEASDFEIMHLLTLGEMPEQKFDAVAEQAIWTLVKEAVIMNTDVLQEDMTTEDIMNIVYEMGPVSEFGYSSAAPILEFSRANGHLSESYLYEFVDKDWTNPGTLDKEAKAKAAAKAAADKAARDKTIAGKYDNAKDAASKYYNKAKTKASDTADAVAAKAAELKAAAAKKAQEVKAKTAAAAEKGKKAVGDTVQTGVDTAKANPYKSGVATGVVAAAGLYGLYKLYKSWKAKRAAAKTEEAKKAADAQLAKIQKKIKSKKS